MTDHSLEHTWSVLAAELRAAVGDRLFEVWLAPLRISAFADGELVLEAPAQTRDWIIERFGQVLEAGVEAVVGRGITVSVDAHGTRREPARRQAPRTGAQTAAHPRYSFGQFVIGESNRLAHASALAVAENPGTAYSPLFICGPPGVGKTHLLHSVARYVAEHDDGIRVRLTSAEAFANEFIGALQGGGIDAFKARHRQVDVLLVDDVQFLMAKARTEEEFFHTFNHLRDSGAQIVLTSDRAPRDLESVEDRLRDRFESGLVAEILEPDLETRRAVLVKRSLQDGMPPPAAEVLDVIATRIAGNLRALEGALIRVVAYASLTGRQVDGALAEEVLDRLGPRRVAGSARGGATIAEIQQLTCEAFGVTREELLSGSREARIAWPRQLAMYLAREHTRASLPSIGAEFGGRGHTTVLHACRRASERIAGDEALAHTVNDLSTRLSRGSGGDRG